MYGEGEESKCVKEECFQSSWNTMFMMELNPERDPNVSPRWQSLWSLSETKCGGFSEVGTTTTGGLKFINLYLKINRIKLTYFDA